MPPSPLASPSENEITHALDAEYVDPRPGSSPATLATLMTVPSSAASIGGSAACVSCMTAVTLTSSWDCSTARSAVQNSPDVPNPALFTSTRTPAASRSATFARSAASARSAAQHFDVGAGLVVQFGGEALQPLDVTGDQYEVVAVDGVAAGESRAEPGCRSSDQCDGAWHAVQVT